MVGHTLDSLKICQYKRDMKKMLFWINQTIFSANLQRAEFRLILLFYTACIYNDNYHYLNSETDTQSQEESNVEGKNSDLFAVIYVATAWNLIE